MSTEMNATETVRKGQRWEPCGSSGCGWWSRRDAEGNEVEHRPLGDPLADTPEGWWEFGQILEWAEGWLEDRGLTLELLCQRGVWKGNIYRGKAWSDTKILTDGESDDQRELAVRLLGQAVEALAEAVGGQRSD